MNKSVQQCGFKLVGEDPAPSPDKASTPLVIRIDIRWERGRPKKDSELETSAYGDGIIF